jgi:methylphosphotriester-DNA--protein-cysteine methyltransferase
VWAWGRGVGNNLGVRLTGATERHTPERVPGLTEVARITRFAHLFRDQVGLPFSRYMLWRKLTRAMVAVASERTIAAAAHAADFADAAHLTRTFYQMVGMAPSALMRGDFIEIASPFSRLIQRQ